MVIAPSSGKVRGTALLRYSVAHEHKPPFKTHNVNLI